MYEEQEIEISKILRIPYYQLLNIIGASLKSQSFENGKIIEHINALNKEFENKNIDIEGIFTKQEKTNIKTLLYSCETYNLQLVKQILISKIKTNV